MKIIEFTNYRDDSDCINMIPYAKFDNGLTVELDINKETAVAHPTNYMNSHVIDGFSDNDDRYEEVYEIIGKSLESPENKEIIGKFAAEQNEKYQIYLNREDDENDDCDLFGDDYDVQNNYDQWLNNHANSGK